MQEMRCFYNNDGAILLHIINFSKINKHIIKGDSNFFYYLFASKMLNNVDNVIIHKSM